MEPRRGAGARGMSRRALLGFTLRAAGALAGATLVPHSVLAEGPRRGRGRRRPHRGRERGAEQDRARAAVRAGEVLPLGRILERLGPRAAGRVLDARLVGQGAGHPRYRLKILRRGVNGDELRELWVDARTGALLGER